MTTYTVSPPMLIEKSDKSEPIKGHYYYGQPGEVYFDEGNYNNDTEAYEQHLSSLQQIRMSDELVKWCEEKGIKEVSSEQIEVREQEDKNNIIDFEGSECYPIYGTIQLAYPAEVVDSWKRAWNEYREDGGPLNDHMFINYLKSHYKLTKL